MPPDHVSFLKINSACLKKQNSLNFVDCKFERTIVPTSQDVSLLQKMNYLNVQEPFLFLLRNALGYAHLIL